MGEVICGKGTEIGDEREGTESRRVLSRFDIGDGIPDGDPVNQTFEKVDDKD